EEPLGVDAVDVLLAEARLGAEVSLVRLGEGDARPPHVLVLASGRGVDADRRRRDVGAELPRLAAVAVGHDLRRLVVELARQVLLPDVRRLEDVRVGRDEMVLTRHTGALRPLSYEQTFVHFKRAVPHAFAGISSWGRNEPRNFSTGVHNTFRRLSVSRPR